MIWFDYELREQLLWGIACLLCGAGWLYAWTRRHKRAGFKFPALRLRGLSSGWRARISHTPLVLRGVTLAFILAALARPQLPQEETADVEGIDIVIALDVSGSMNAIDMNEADLIELQNRGQFPQNRFEIAVQVIKDFISSRSYDRVSLVIFGEEAFVQFPLTLDYGVMLKILDEMRLGDVSGDGTVIGNALGLSFERLKESEATSKLVIMLTDGEDRGSNVAPRQVAELLKEEQVKVYPILVGSEVQSWMPTEQAAFSGQRVSYQPVDNQVNPELLKDLAKLTEGAYYRASDSKSLSSDFQDILDAFEKSRLIDYATARRAEMFPYLIWAAIGSLLLELLLSTLVLRRYP